MPLVIYTLLRMLLVVAAGAVLYWVGMRGMLLVVVAVIVGALLSFLVLRGPRERAAGVLQGFAEREPAPVKPDADSLAEDQDVDSAEPQDETEREPEQ